MATEAASKISDEIFVEMIECQPEAEAAAQVVSVTATASDDAAPQQQAAQATIEQTGADPPPEGS